MEMTFRKVKGKEIYFSDKLFSIYANNMQSYMDAETVKIELNEKTGIYRVGVWDTDEIGYDMITYANCNSDNLYEAMANIAKKIK